MEGDMTEISVGLRGVQTMVVEPHHLASFVGNIGVQVLSTHHVVLLMEQAARNAIANRLPEDTITVGTMIRIAHFGAALLGARVRAEGFLKHVEGRRLVFDVAAYDEHEQISEGENEQLILPVAKFIRKLMRKQVDPGIV